MLSIESILQEYEKGDFDKRLHLFLECPSLRNWFMEIDQRETTGEYPGETSG